MFRLALLCAAFGYASAAMAEPQAAPPPATPQAPAAQKKICRTDPSTGSILPRRTCRTAVEWQQWDAANRKALDAERNRKDNDRMLQGTQGRE